MSRLTLVLLAVVSVLPLPSTAVALEPVVLGYYPGYEKFPIEQIPFERLTHVCHAFVTSDEEGVLEANRLAPNKQLTALATEHGVPVILSIGGWGDADGFEAATSSPEKMARWVDDAVAMMHDNGYRGLDVDWEFPRDESTRNRFTQLVLALRKKMDALTKQTGTPYLITSAVTARPPEGQWIDGPAMEPAIDFLNVMTYDFAGPWTDFAAHHSPLERAPNDPIEWRSTVDAMEYWHKTQQFPKSKLVVGIPLYGRKMPVREPLASIAGLPKEGFGTPFYRDLIKLLDQGWTHMTGPSGAPFIVAPEGENGLISFDTPESAQRTGNWSHDHGYRGIFFWGIGQDHVGDSKFPVMNAAIDGFREAATAN